jgi:hypothetical protein
MPPLEENKMSSNVNHPKHYNDGKIEVIEFIEDKQLGFHLGNAVKYIARAGKKDPAKHSEDLEKAIWYIRRKIEIYSALNPRRPNDMNPRDEEYRGEPDGTHVCSTCGDTLLGGDRAFLQCKGCRA